MNGKYFVPYCSVASTSIGAVVPTATQVIQPDVKLAKVPNARCG